jgi:hypothetical protein
MLIDVVEGRLLTPVKIPPNESEIYGLGGFLSQLPW